MKHVALIRRNFTRLPETFLARFPVSVREKHLVPRVKEFRKVLEKTEIVLKA